MDADRRRFVHAVLMERFRTALLLYRHKGQRSIEEATVLKRADALFRAHNQMFHGQSVDVRPAKFDRILKMIHLGMTAEQIAGEFIDMRPTLAPTERADGANANLTSFMDEYDDDDEDVSYTVTEMASGTDASKRYPRAPRGERKVAGRKTEHIRHGPGDLVVKF